METTWFLIFDVYRIMDGVRLEKRECFAETAPRRQEVDYSGVQGSAIVVQSILDKSNFFTRSHDVS